MFVKQLREYVGYTINLFHVVKNMWEWRAIKDNFKIDKVYDTKFIRVDNNDLPWNLYHFTPRVGIFQDEDDFDIDLLGFHDINMKFPMSFNSD